MDVKNFYSESFRNELNKVYFMIPDCIHDFVIIDLEIQPFNPQSAEDHQIPRNQFDWSSEFKVWKEQSVVVTVSSNKLKELSEGSPFFLTCSSTFYDFMKQSS